MKEITRVMTLQITHIDNVEDDEIEGVIKANEQVKDVICGDVKKIFNADDATAQVQLFIMDKE